MISAFNKILGTGPRSQMVLVADLDFHGIPIIDLKYWLSNTLGVVSHAFVSESLSLVVRPKPELAGWT